jgi:2,3-bisphosphoglycerate-independent phosphoglycerate mutase
MKKPTILLILDGFGLNDHSYGNAIRLAHTPNLDHYFNNYPSALVHASGLDVGLPKGQMGNSEVGHLNIGAGRIVYQELTRISKSIEDEDFFQNPAFLEAIKNVKIHGSSLHLFGLLSNGGVHSHNTHLYALLKLAKKAELTHVYIHAFLDGRDVPPTSALGYVEELENKINEIGIGKIATISGRYYAMDRDNRWERISLAYDAMVSGLGEKANSAKEAIELSYAKNNTDEFVQPTVIHEKNIPIATIQPNDSIILFNFRPDRAREITRTFVDPNFEHFNRKKGFFPVHYVCMTQYDASMPNVHIAYKPEVLKNTFGEYIANKGLKQLRIAETEKYAHVTFFFNGGIETPYEGETRILIPSPKVATYDEKPEMRAYEVTNRLIEEMNKNIYDVIILNYANPDMVGHTGSLEATIKAIEVIDDCVDKVVEATIAKGGQILLTADHGNSDQMLDEKGNTITAHSINPVPLVLINANEKLGIIEGRLADIAPTLLEMMELSKPKEMTGKSLLVPLLKTAVETA